MNWVRDAGEGLGQDSLRPFPLDMQGSLGLEHEERQVQCNYFAGIAGDDSTRSFLEVVARRAVDGLATYARTWDAPGGYERVGRITGIEGGASLGVGGRTGMGMAMGMMAPTPQVGDPLLDADVVATGPEGGVELRLEFPEALHGPTNTDREQPAWARLGPSTVVELRLSAEPRRLAVEVIDGWLSLAGSWGFPTEQELVIVGRSAALLLERGEILVNVNRAAGLASFYLGEGSARSAAQPGQGPVQQISLSQGDEITVGTRGTPARLRMRPGQYGQLSRRHITVASSGDFGVSPDVVGQIVFSEGAVIGVRRDGSPYRLRPDDQLLVPMFLETRRNSRARLRIGGDDVSIGASSSVHLYRLDAGLGVGLWGGVLRAESGVNSGPEQKVRQIRAGNVVAEIRGTDFVTVFDRDSGELAFHLREGALQVSSESSGRALSLQAGQSVTMNDGGTIGTPGELNPAVYEDLLARVEPRPEGPPAQPSGEGLPPGVEVTALVFFESGFDAPPQAQREYRESFDTGARYINVELRLAYPEIGERWPFEIEAVVTKDGEPFARFGIATALERGWVDSFHQSGWGAAEGGNWVPGTYQVELSVGGRVMARGSFRVTPAR